MAEKVSLVPVSSSDFELALDHTISRQLDPSRYGPELNGRQFDVSVSVTFESFLHPGDWDAGLVNVYLHQVISRVVKAVLEHHNPEWKISVSASSKKRR